MLFRSRFDRYASFFQAVRQDPALAGIKLIAEPWDAAGGGYQLGAYLPGWSEWNDRFRDTTRCFWLQPHKDRGAFAGRPHARRVPPARRQGARRDRRRRRGARRALGGLRGQTLLPGKSDKFVSTKVWCVEGMSGTLVVSGMIWTTPR